MFRKIYSITFALLCTSTFIAAEGEEEVQIAPEETQYFEQQDYRYNNYRRKWRDDRFLERQYQDSDWPSRRGEELSDILSR